MKYDWKKQDKAIYSPPKKPVTIVVPRYKYFMLEGKGNPNGEAFSEAVGILYGLSYGVKMLPKKGINPEGYYDYAVFPLEGTWWQKEESDALNKDQLHYQLMIRQPDFVTESLVEMVMEMTAKKKPHPLLEKVQMAEIEDGLSVQMLHIGPYDDEPVSFRQMMDYCIQRKLERVSSKHREIYLKDARKTSQDKMQTVLRYFVKETA